MELGQRFFLKRVLDFPERLGFSGHVNNDNLNKPTTMTTNLIETDSLRIRQINSATEKLGLATRLISIKTVLHRARYADQQTDYVGEIHTVETNGVRNEVPIWFRGERVVRVG